MIYSYNTLGFYGVKANRQYDNAYNQSIIHIFETDKLPDFQIVIDDTVDSASYILYDLDDNQIKTGSITPTNTTNNEGTAYSIIALSGAVTVASEEGHYYIRVAYVVDGETYYAYSDVFCWQTTLTDYLKISAVSTGISIGGFPIDAQTYEVYLESKRFTEEHEIFEQGDEKTFGDVPAYVSVNRTHSHEILGYNKTANFLSGLRAIGVNGTITITWASESIEIYDIQMEQRAINNYDSYVIDLKFKLKDYLQVINTI